MSVKAEDAVKVEAKSRPVTPSVDDFTHAKIKQLRKRSMSRKNSVSSETSNGDVKPIIERMDTAETQDVTTTTSNAAAEPKKLSPMEELIKAATIMNPKVFELPREFNIYSQFPGEDKRKPNLNNFSEGYGFYYV